MRSRRWVLFIAAASCILSYSSCVKKYTCVCTLKYSGAPGMPDSTKKEWEITDSKTSAKSTCEKESGTYQNNGITTNETCVLY